MTTLGRESERALLEVHRSLLLRTATWLLLYKRVPVRTEIVELQSIRFVSMVDNNRKCWWRRFSTFIKASASRTESKTGASATFNEGSYSRRKERSVNERDDGWQSERVCLIRLRRCSSVLQLDILCVRLTVLLFYIFLCKQLSLRLFASPTCVCSI